MRVGSTPSPTRAERYAVRSCLSVEQRAYPMRTVSMGQLYVKGTFTEKNIGPSFRYRRLPAFSQGGRTMADRPRSDPPTDSLYEGDEGEAST